VAVASVTYNTRAHLARLLFSLHRTVADDVVSVIIVDNGSTDGSVQLLEAAAEADLCGAIFNARKPLAQRATLRQLLTAPERSGCRSAGLTLTEFPFTGSGRLIHVGRGTLRGVVERREVEASAKRRLGLLPHRGRTPRRRRPLTNPLRRSGTPPRGCSDAGAVDRSSTRARRCARCSPHRSNIRPRRMRAAVPGESCCAPVQLTV